MKRLPRLLELNALSITLIYLVTALLWILLSDQFLVWITDDPQLISQYQTYKGIFYVLLTGLLLYILVTKSNEKTYAKKDRIDNALYAAGMATWSIDIGSKNIRRSEYHYKVFGYSKRPRRWSIDDFYDRIHPEDRTRVKEALEKTIEKEAPLYHVKFRIINSDNDIRWLESRGNLVFEEDEPIQLAGVVADITEQKKLEEAYQHEKELFESIFENIPVIVDIYDPEINEIRVNKYFEKYLGWSNEEIKEIDLMKACYPDPEIREEVLQIMNETDGEWHELEVTDKQGKKRIQSWSNIRLSDNTTIGIGLDITEQRRLEKEHEEDRLELQKIYDNIPVLVNLHDKTGNVYRVNKYFEEVVGFTNEEAKEINLMGKMLPNKKARKKAEKHMSYAHGNWHDFKIMTKDRGEIFTTWTNIKVTDDLTIGIGIDTTELKQKERELQELTSRYKNAEKLAQLGNWKRDLKTDETIISDGFYRILEVDRDKEELNFKKLKEIIHPEDWDAFIEAIENAMETGSIDTNYRIIKQKSEEMAHIHELGQVDFDSDGDPVKISGTVQDITEMKKSQEEIRESRELLKKTFESLYESVIILDHPSRTIASCNPITYDLFGYSEDELIGRSTKMLHVDESNYKEFGEKSEDVLESKDVFQTEFVMKRKDGTTFYSDHTVTLVKNDAGDIEKIVSVVRDITDKKEHERELQELTDRYRNAERIARTGHWWRNVQTDEAIWSQGFYDIIGLTPGDIDTSYESLLEMIHPDDREEFDTAFKNALESGSLNIRYRLIKPNTGEVGYYHELAKTEYDEHGEPLYISGSIQDLTELEEFQIQLKQRNDFIETTLENIPIGVAVNLMDSGEATLMNKKFSDIYGWPQEIIKDVNTFYEKIYPDEAYRNRMVEMIMADINSKDPERMSWNGIKVVTQKGEEKIIDTKNIPLYDQNLMISTVVDVTAQAKAEKRLAESEHNYRLLFQKSPEPMIIYDPDSLKFIEVNNAAVSHYGYSRKEFYSMTLLDIRPKEDWDELKKIVSEDKGEKFTTSKEARHLKKSGEIIYVKVTGSSINYFGNPYRLVLINDMTEQKKAEEMVLASLVEGENKERARIAQELHDGLGQYLAAANMNLDAASSEIDCLSDRKQQQFQKGLTLLKHAVSETGQISRNLLPRVVDDYGLALAIESLVDNYKIGSDIKITYYQNIKDLDLPREVQFNLYRIAQEGLSNAVKYSEASTINVQLIKDELDLILTIDDNGKGFDTEFKDFKAGLGLQTIKTRAGALGGTFEFDSKPNKGTFLNIVVPILNQLKES
ncbi:MAG: PAS domain S-box protein [Gracilimonas sp.]